VASIDSYAPSRALRASLFVGLATRGVAYASVPPFGFVLTFLAVMASFTFSGNTLNILGTHYAEPGGNPLLKIHPATYLAVMAATASLVSRSSAQSRLGYVFGRAPALFFFVGLTIFCTAFACFNAGLTGVGVYVDNYLSAGALAIAMFSASGRQRRVIAHLILVLCVINVLISLAEYVHQEHFIPLDMKLGDGTAVGSDDKSEEFRPAALYTHPLTGAMATAFGLFLALDTKLRFGTAAICIGTFAVGLLGFGGRAALGVTIGLLVARVIITLARDFLNGRINGRLLGTIFMAVCLLGPLTTYLLTETPVGERIAARAYYDESAEVRSDQWQVFSKVNTQQALYGTPVAEVAQIYEQVGLNYGVENPLILIFLNLGIIGSPILILGLVIYFLYLRQAYPESGWLLLAAAFIFFSSNSIGSKSPDLFMMTACAVTMKRQLEDRSARTGRMFRSQLVSLRSQSTGLTRDPDVGRTIMSLRKAARHLSPYVVKRPGPAPRPPTPMPHPASAATPTPVREAVSTMLTPTSGGSIVDDAGNIWTLTATGDVDKNGATVHGGGGIAALTYSNNTIWGKDATSSHWYIYSNGIWKGPVAAPPTAAR
jgi:hypothetical protein